VNVSDFVEYANLISATKLSREERIRKHDLEKQLEMVSEMRDFELLRPRENARICQGIHKGKIK